MIDYLVEKRGAKMSNFHLIGHSLGAHTVGYAGQFTRSGKIPRISGRKVAFSRVDSYFICRPRSLQASIQRSRCSRACRVRTALWTRPTRTSSTSSTRAQEPWATIVLWGTSTSSRTRAKPASPAAGDCTRRSWVISESFSALNRLKICLAFRGLQPRQIAPIFCRIDNQ